MTIGTLVLNIGIVAILLTIIIGFGFKKHKSWLMTFLQNFTGVLFMFSGWVKAIDPLGTAYKMEQYFAEFETTFSHTWFSFIAPIFPALSKISIWFSVAMIIFEIALGIMLVLGIKSKFTSWAFLLLVVFFTVLTGFTFLTGYVPDGTNFFDFSSWGAYKDTNMKVTDCGCFGDFIKLKPKVSFIKDLVLLLPSIYFVFKYKDMHELFTAKVRNIILGVSIVTLLFYCLNNFMWNLPHTDFRPFKIGADVAKIKEEEEASEGAVEITHWVLKSKKDGSTITLPNAEYMSNLAKYPKTEYEVVDQVKTEPKVPHTKISDFDVEDFQGNDVTYNYLDNEKYHFMLVCYKGYFTTSTSTKMITDTLTVTDTIITGKDTSFVDKKSVVQSEAKVTDYIWDPSYKADFEKMKPFLSKAIAEGNEVSIVMGGINEEAAKDLKDELGLNLEVYTADDILLKTIVRSNPGIVLWKDGKIINKWHKRRLPTFEEVKSEMK